MSGETKAQVSAWNTDTLKEYVEVNVDKLEKAILALRAIVDERDRRYEDRFRATDEKTSLALTASEKAGAKAETATEKRFDSVNEFRETLSDQATNLMPRGEANAKFTALEEKFSGLKDEVTRGMGAGVGGKAVKDETRSNVQLLLAVVGGAIAALAFASRFMAR